MNEAKLCEQAPPALVSEAMQVAACLPVASLAFMEDEETKKPLALLPPGWSTKDLSGLFPMPAPTYRKAVVALFSVESFVAYVLRWATPETTVWMDREKSTIMAMIDDGKGPDGPGRRAHVAFYKAEYAQEFAEWTEAAVRPMGQKAFIVFVEEHDRHFITPTGAVMRTVANQLEVKKGVTFKNIEREDSAAADVSLVYESQTTEMSAVKCPTELKIRIPVHRGGTLYDINCRLRFDLEEGRLVFILRLPEKQRLIDEAWKKVCSEMTGMMAAVSMPAEQQGEEWQVPVFEGSGPSQLDI